MLQLASCLSLEGKRVLVTGSSGGIGAAIAKRLSAEGAHVLVHYNTRRQGAIETFKSIEKEGKGTCMGIVQCDFRSPNAIKDMIEVVLDKIWRDGLDILVNNAGIVSKVAVQDDDDNLSVWHETLAVNLHAPLQLSKLCFSRFRKGGVICNVSSIHGQRSVEWMTAYAASKAALDSLTRGLAAEWAPHGVRVNAIAPGVVPVERTREAFALPGTTEMWLPHLPLQKLGTVEEVADATLTLITNTWMTGTILNVDGGMMARSNMPIRPRPAVVSQADSCNDISDTATFEDLSEEIYSELLDK